MLIILLGLPGTGRKTLMQQLSNHYKADCFYDFVPVTISHTNITVTTMFTEFSTPNIGEMKVMYVVLDRVFKKSFDKKYQEFFQIDMNILYGQDLFNDLDELEQFNSKLIYYDYNFDNLVKEIDAFYNKNIDFKESIHSLLAERGLNIPLSMINLGHLQRN